MIHVVTCANRHLYADQLLSMYQVRRQHYIEDRGWGELWDFGGVEIDDFDDERAVYLLELDAEGGLAGFLRVRPTDDRSILVDKFAHLIGPGQPQMKGPEAWEGSRIFAMPGVQDARVTMMRLHLASDEVALEAGAKRMTAFIDVHNYPHLSDGSAEFLMTGPPQPYRYGVMVGLRREIDEASIARLRDSLAEPARVSYLVTEEDLCAHRSLAAVQRAIDAARRADAGEARVDQATPAKTRARITALYVRHDCGAGSPPAPAEAPAGETPASEAPQV